MNWSKPEPVTVKLSLDKIKGFLSSLPGLNGNLEKKRKMAFAAVEHLDTYFAGTLGENDHDIDKSMVMAIGEIDLCASKPQIPWLGSTDLCASKPQIPSFSEIDPCASKPQIPNGF